MRRASTLAAAALAATGVMALAGAAAAQAAPTAGQAHGLRYMSWPGRGEASARSPDAAAPPAPARADLRRPNPVIPHGGFAAVPPPAPSRLTPAPGAPRRTLTPANAWLQPRPAPAEPAPAPAGSPAPPAPVMTPPPSAPRPTPGPEYLPDQGGRSQPAPAAAVYAAPASSDAAAADPMAPRRDAPVFRMRQAPPPQTAPDTSPPAEAPGAEATRSGGRYYSVHRQNGREPDAVAMPEPTYVDALVVSGVDSIASQDLAQPEPGPTLIRDRNGSTRPVPASSDGDYQ